MAGRLARDASHLDGSEPIGVWFDVAWATYADLISELDRDMFDHIKDRWDDLSAELDENGKPTPESWGASESAQQGQAALMAMFGGSPDMGVAPPTGGAE